MYALFVLWRGTQLRAVEVLENTGGCDLNATARQLLEEYRFDALHDPDSCMIYVTQGNRLAFVGGEVSK